LPRDVVNVRYFGASERSPDDSIDRTLMIDRRIEATCRAFICEMVENDRRRRTIDWHDRAYRRRISNRAAN
jgi:hypothetical protein